MVAATIRTIFAQPTAALVREQVDTVADILAPKFPAVAEMLHDAKADLTAFADFPTSHWRKVWSSNPNRAPQPRNQAPHRRRRHLPQPRSRHPPGRRDPHRATRGMAGQRPTLPVRGVHGRTRHASHPKWTRQQETK
jgi:hypothetical protein